MRALRSRPHDPAPRTTRRAGATGRLVLLATALLIGIPTAVSAHEHGVLTVSNQALVAGDTILISGTKFAARGELTLALVGLRGRIRLGVVRADTNGAFQTVIHLPGDVQPGSYRIVATATDGDEVAAIDVAVVPGTSRSPSRGEDSDTRPPSSAPLQLSRARSPAVTGAALLATALALVLGVALLRRPTGA